MAHPQLEHGYILLTFKPGRRQGNIQKLIGTKTTIPGELSVEGQPRAMSGLRIDSIDVMEDPTDDVIVEVTTVHPLKRKGPGHYQIEALTDWLAGQFRDDLADHKHWCCISDM